MAIDKDTRFDISKLNVDLPQSWSLGDDIPWDAPLSATFLNVELPFWFMLSNDNLTIEHNGCFTPKHSMTIGMNYTHMKWPIRDKTVYIEGSFVSFTNSARRFKKP